MRKPTCCISENKGPGSAVPILRIKLCSYAQFAPGAPGSKFTPGCKFAPLRRAHTPINRVQTYLYLI